MGRAPEVCSAHLREQSVGCSGSGVEGGRACDRPLQMLREMLAMEATVAPTAEVRTPDSALPNAAESSCRIMSVPGRLPSLPSQDAVSATRSVASSTWRPPLALGDKSCVA